MSVGHIEAKENDIAKVVLMPGDPLRAKNIADNYLHNVRLVNSVRGMYTYTGYTKNNVRMSVMGSGMGQPSMGIYCYELFKFYDVDLIIRVGTCASYQDSVNLKDIIIGSSAATKSNFAYQLNRKNVYKVSASKTIEKIVKQYSKDYTTRFGTIYTSDAFYGETDDLKNEIRSKGYIAVEMEGFALYYTAKMLNKHAITIMTATDVYTKARCENLDSKYKENSLYDMVSLAIKVSEDFLNNKK